MSRPLFGELLGRYVQLSNHDISEILEEQVVTQRRFGEIALALRLCRPQDIWKAWWTQLAEAPERVDLNTVGVDAQALAFFPRSLAEQFGVMPIRAMDGMLVLAASDETLTRAQQELPSHFGRDVRFVIAPSTQIDAAFASYYRKAG